MTPAGIAAQTGLMAMTLNPQATGQKQVISL
jgi:hypothetical protein